MKRQVECKSVPCMLSEAVARRVDELASSLPKDCTYQRKAYVPTDVHFEPGERADVSIITTNHVDKSNEVVLPDGINLDSFRENSVVLFEHKSNEIVGHCTWIKYYDNDATLRAKTTYFENQDRVESKWYRFIDEVWEMVKAGAMKGKSIGFLPTVPKREPTEEELAAHPEWQGAGIWEQSILLEYSVCPVGVNNQALVELVSQAKGITAEVLKSMGIPVEMPQEAPQATQAPPVDINAIIAQAIATAIPLKRKAKPKPRATDVLFKALEELQVDPERILRLAEQEYRNRGRV